MERSRTVLFHRDFRAFSGGHLKVWHYFGHAASAPGHAAEAYLTPDSVWDPSNPWSAVRDRVRSRWEPDACDVLFLAGLDWLALAPSARAAPPRPVINLIQHVRHADPADPRYAFLDHPATRICVSPEVASAIGATGRVRGPVVTIPNGCDVPIDNLPDSPRTHDIVIAATKAPDLGRALAADLAGSRRRIHLLDSVLPRSEFLAALRGARVAVLLPHATEGFYLPALEAMAAGCLVVCPDCVGNRGFCHDGENCFRPEFTRAAIRAAAEAALACHTAVSARLRTAARETVAAHPLDQERRAFQAVLDGIPTGGPG